MISVVRAPVRGLNEITLKLPLAGVAEYETMMVPSGSETGER